MPLGGREPWRRPSPEKKGLGPWRGPETSGPDGDPLRSAQGQGGTLWAQTHRCHSRRRRLPPHRETQRCSPSLLRLPPGCRQMCPQLGLLDPPSLAPFLSLWKPHASRLCFRAHPPGDPHLLPPPFRSLLIRPFPSQEKQSTFSACWRDGA